ncbi:GPW/gp25 family protein [Niveispirillum sp. SYP-B3756]|uniref:GPW/gp25 family protein n=1 Tax=Niveispirillum sp. SYP-B3756 TaxID=2662178 RepID=UPI001290B68B|nr:GPW/gp25 family protein [Niveispirillum sp. SYP-B3756]
MRGMNRETGKAMDGLAHMRQSVLDILGTPLGSRVMRRDYGSALPDLIGAPVGPELLIEVAAACALALRKWEPRFRLTRVRLAVLGPGQLSLDLVGVYRPDGREITLDGLVIA